MFRFVELMLRWLCLGSFSYWLMYFLIVIGILKYFVRIICRLFG